MRPTVGSRDSRGFALLEVLITAGFVVAIAAGASQIVAIAIRASHGARVRTMSTLLAAGKMEQLRSLAWTHTTTSSPAISISSSDVSTDLSSDPAASSPSRVKNRKSNVSPGAPASSKGGCWWLSLLVTWCRCARSS